MLSRMMLTGANALIMDEPTNHLDLESITALNNGLIAFTEVVLFSSHDREFVSTVAKPDRGNYTGRNYRPDDGI